jgi:lysophospholipase L1-like esterase
VDRTCAGATSVDVLSGGQFFQDAQLNAVDRRTRLVTITIGGNDVFYLSNLVAESCDRRTPFIWRALGACRVRPAEAVNRGFIRLQSNFSKIVAAIHQRAPLARVVLVNYLTVLPEEGTCAKLGLNVRQADAMRTVALRLQDATRKAAVDGVSLLDAAALSKGHDVCSPDPWIASAHPASLHIAPLHPNIEGMTAVADALAAAGRAPSSPERSR